MYTLDYLEYAACAREAAAEGMVLLKNEGGLLPLEMGSKLALFGRTQYDTIYCGTGSGGMVNVPYVVSIHEGLGEVCELCPALDEAYEAWRSEHPFDKGEGWAATPWSQAEMPLEDGLLEKARAFSDTAVFVIGRTAGEDRDNKAAEGAYYLQPEELEILRQLRRLFPKLAVLINAGNIMDLSWDEEIKADALLYLWQGGCETGHAAADIVCGRVNPSGRLPDTVARFLEDYPAHANFGDGVENIYAEDIYVGYRYFETFAPEKVLYPFGFGLSYTDFSYQLKSAEADAEGRIRLKAAVSNTGKRAGKTLLQLYLSAPQGELGKPSRVLAGWHKTALLEPGETCEADFEIEPYVYASYDDRPESETSFSYILEQGLYRVSLGFDVRRADTVYEFRLPETLVLERLSQQGAPSKAFAVLYPKAKEDGEGFDEAYRLVNLKRPKDERACLPESRPYEPGASGVSFEDYAADGSPEKLEALLASLSDTELIRLSLGIGMGPSGVTPGVAGAFGAVSPALKAAGLPLLACSDGPSGIRMDNGAMAFSLPNGTCLAAGFNEKLNETLFGFLGMECRKNHIASILGPGMNIHRYPLCGRNFEYFSEDPLLTGRMAAAQCRGLKAYGTAATVKHFALNNQEYQRGIADSAAGERAVREIYLKGFEIAVRSKALDSIMTGYNRINGRHAASHYEFNTEILRGEWGYQGIVMTDWWADINYEDYGEVSRHYLSAMIAAQNDLYMVVPDAVKAEALPEALRALEDGRLSRGELLRNARNILRFLRLYSEAHQPYELEVKNEPEIRREGQVKIELGRIGAHTRFDLSHCPTGRGQSIMLAFEPETMGRYELKLHLSSHGGEVAQMNISFEHNLIAIGTLSLTGESERHEESLTVDCSLNPNNFIELFFSEGGITLYEGELRLIEASTRV